MTRHPIPLSTSAMIQRLPKAAIPGGLSLSRYTLSNGASLASATPLCTLLPQQQWAFGILFPLDHTALGGRPAGEPCVVQVRLVVEGGMVGVAPCNPDGAFTEHETFASGTTEVRMTLSRPTDTNSVVIREVSGAKDVRVTVLDIGIFEAGEEGLAPRSHNLGFDLFVILSPPKTGTQTLEHALHTLSPAARVHRVHYASTEGCRWLRAFASAAAVALGPEHEIVRANHFEADAGDLARLDIATVRRLNGRVAFFTAVRDPIGRAIANMFESLPNTIQACSHLYAFGGSVFAQMLADGLVAAWDKELRESTQTVENLSWYECLDEMLWSRCLVTADYISNEFRNVTGFDPLLQGFNTRDGYARLAIRNDEAVVFRTSALDRSLRSALLGLTGCSLDSFDNRNIGEMKDYAKLYKEVDSRIRVPGPLAKAVYRRHKYLTHFFDENEIQALVQRWNR